MRTLLPIVLCLAVSVAARSDDTCDGPLDTGETSVRGIASVAAAGVDPRHLQFEAASEAEVVDSLWKDSRFCRDQVGELGYKPHPPDERRMVEQQLQRMAPLFRCRNKPPIRFARVGKIYMMFKGEDCKSEFASYDCNEVDGGVCDLVSGVSYFRDPEGRENGLIIVADEVKKPKKDPTLPPGYPHRVHLLIHEAGHYFFDRFDPQSCTPYPNPLDPPELKKFMAAVGWDPTGDTVVSVPGNGPPTRYAGSYGPVEDFMESFAMFLIDPDLLKEKSLPRFEYFRNLLTAGPVQ